MRYSLIEWDEGWNSIQKSMNKLNRVIEGLSETPFDAEDFMMLYTTIYNMCTQPPPHDYCHQLYDKYKETIEQHITLKRLPSLAEKHEEFMLQEFVKSWERHKVRVKRMSHCFFFLARHFIPSRSLTNLEEVGLNCFRELNLRARVAAFSLIDREREGERIDRGLLKNVMGIIVEIGTEKMDAYKEDIEGHLLKSSGEYYSRKASSWIAEESYMDYMVKAELCLRREKNIVSHYLHSSSEKKLVEKVEHELFEPLANAFKQKVSLEVKALVQQAKDHASSNQDFNGAYGMQEHVLVRNILELHTKYLAFFSDCLIKNYIFHRALRDSFDLFWNGPVAGSLGAELLAAFCDNLLKNDGNEKLSDEAAKDTLEKVAKLVSYMSSKDLFIEFYKKRLIPRLLFDRSSNLEREKSFVTNLKQKLGGTFLTSRIDKMVEDMTWTQDNKTSFSEYLHSNPNVNPGLDFTVTVLTTGLWPSYKPFNLNLPAEMKTCVEAFEGFHETKTKCRKLNWINSLGTCYINSNFESKTIELVVSSCQAALLLLFSDADRLSYSEIFTQLNLDHDDLVQTLYSLSYGKYKILLKEPNTKNISPNDSFEFNSKFTGRMKRIKIPHLPLYETKEVIKEVEKDRRYAIDAAITRIMKKQKVLDLQQLFVECVEKLGHIFKPDIKTLKQRIENLIDRDYLERDKENHNIFKYLV
ncbi:hypothetical protein L3X38_027641 [Prunus dulcis]|uniref:Cullin family profile domain-containing protein n=1 Tax=Prunus dulcis TaxID=3755 RepID=A0AAD4VNC8_PRUDU|nr:hypothetical protein L3X38_027641 [Prunus dulcis]